jgi:OmpA-OmpF porin, OOP family
MKGKKVRVIIAILLVSLSFASGQKWKLNRYELHFGLGTANVFGDIGGTADKSNLFGLKDIRLKETGLSVYLGGRYKLKVNQALKVNLIFGYTKGADIGSRNENRLFSYKTTIFEPSCQYEYYFLAEDRNYRPSTLYNRRGMINNFSLLSIYGFGGLGGAIFSPKVSYGGRLPDPRIETTEDFAHFSLVIPIGIGFKMAYDKSWSVGFEFGRRFTFTDYIDGLSASFSHAKDTYYFGVVHVIYKIETDRFGKPMLFKRQRLR